MLKTLESFVELFFMTLKPLKRKREPIILFGEVTPGGLLFQFFTMFARGGSRVGQGAAALSEF